MTIALAVLYAVLLYMAWRDMRRTMQPRVQMARKNARRTH